MTRAPALAWEVAGPATGRAVVLLHAIGTDRESWRPLVPRLARAGFRVVLVDLRGHGRAPAPPGPYDLSELADDVLRVLDALGLRSASLAGVSLGGMVAQWAAIHAPERVDRLVLCCTAAYLGGPSEWGPRAAAARAHGTASLATAALERWLTPAFAVAHPAVVAGLRRTMAATSDEGYAGCAEAIGAMDLRAGIRGITAPTLVVAGVDDPATTVNDHARPLADAVPGARLRLVPDAAHLAQVERPAAVADLLLEHLEDPTEDG